MSTLDRTVCPPFSITKSIDFQWPTTYQLDENRPLFILKGGSQPIVELELICQSGSWYESKHGVANFTAKMLLEGNRKKSAKEIATYIDQYGASINTHVQPDFFSIGLTTLSKYLEPMLALLAELLLESIFPEGPLERLKNIKKQSIKVSDSKNDHVAHKQFKSMLFTEQHPYGKSLKEGDVAAIATDDVRSYHNTKLLANATFFMSGQVEEADVELVRKYLQPVLTKATPIHQVDPLPVCSPQQLHIEKEGSLQAAINIGKRLFTKNHPDYLPLLVVNELLGGYFGSRLMRNIREEKGYTYGIHSSIVARKNSGYFCISTEVMQQHTTQTCQEIHKEIKLLHTELVATEELEKLRNYMLGNFLSSINDPFSIMKRFQSAHLYGLDQNYYEQFYATVSTITPQRIKELAQQYLVIDSLSQVVVG